MAPKRKASMRARKERPTKKRIASPTPEASSPATPEVVEPPLPFKIEDGEPLPTVEEPQPDDLPAKEYQSIMESRVLAASLQQSRQKWLAEGIFERYWIKPTKKKNQAEFKNPPKESMFRLGHVTVTIEPHVFEATLYGVKDTQPRAPAPPPPPPAQAMQRPIIQYGPPLATPNPAQTPQRQPAQPSQQPQQPQQPQQSPPGAVPQQHQPAGPPTGPQLPQTAAPQTPLQAPQGPQAPQPSSQPAPVPAQPQTPMQTPQTQQPGAQAQTQTQNHLEAQQPSQPPQQQQQQHPPPAPQGAPPQSSHQPPHSQPQPTPQLQQHQQQHRQPSMYQAQGQMAAPRPGPVNQPATHQNAPPQPHTPASQTSGAHGRPGRPPNTPSTAHSSSSQSAPRPSPDPVIQMLATRAATDHGLKALMRIVASGEASHEQLKIFQGHIDELTAIIKSRRNEAPPQPSPRSAHPPPNTPRPHQQPHPPQPQNARPTPSPASASTYSRPPHTPGPTPVKTEHFAHPYTASPPVPKPRGGAAHAKPDVSAVLLEFTAGSSDRFLFPKHSILEYMPGGTQVIASFLLVRKGSASQGGSYESNIEYYQPVTLRLTSSQARILEPLSRAVAPPEETRKYMDDIMDKMTRAESVYLAMRLPKDPKDIDQEEEAAVPAKEPVEDEWDWLASSLIVPRTTTSKRNQLFSADRSSVDEWGSPGPFNEGKIGRGSRRQADPNKSCHICHTSVTSLWRKADIDGQSVSVCNACGIKWKTTSARTQDPAHPQISPPAKKGEATPKVESPAAQPLQPQVLQTPAPAPAAETPQTEIEATPTAASVAPSNEKQEPTGPEVASQNSEIQMQENKLPETHGLVDSQLENQKAESEKPATKEHENQQSEVQQQPEATKTETGDSISQKPSQQETAKQEAPKQESIDVEMVDGDAPKENATNETG